MTDVFGASLLLATLAFTSAEARLAFATADGLVEACTPRDGGTVGSARAADWIAARVRLQGASATVDRFQAMTPDGPCTFSNVVCEFERDPAGPWVVLVSHFDTKAGTGCPGANDGASTTGLLVALAKLLSSGTATSNNVQLVWTDGEECRRAYGADDGFQGSRRAAAGLKRSGRQVRAVVCLDMLGDRDLLVSVPRNGTPALRRLVRETADRLGLGASVKLTDMLVKDDHVPFLNAGFPSVDLIDFEYGGEPGDSVWWHTKEDTTDKISQASLLAAGRLVVGLLGAL